MKIQKRVGVVKTRDGFEVKVFANQRTGTVMPTNWKQQASILAGPMVITTRMKHRAYRRSVKRRAWLAKLNHEHTMDAKKLSLYSAAGVSDAR